jgi:cobalt/nickel transport system permease protein
MLRVAGAVRTDFLDKTLLAVAQVAERSFFAEHVAQKKGLLQSLDVRIKLVSFLFLIILASMLRTPQTLWLLYTFGLVIALVSAVPPGLFLKRVWFFVPLFSAAIVLPALLNIVTPGDPILVLIKLRSAHHWGPYTIPQEIAITRQGLWGSILFVSRVAASVSFAVLFTITTRWSSVFSGLSALFVPRIFVMTLSMTERFLFVFLRMIQDMYRGRKSRTIKTFSNDVERNWTASRIGLTFKKSMEMAEDVYRAMLSRGFHGEFPSLVRSRAAMVDYIWLVTVVCFGGILMFFERGIIR